MSARTHRSLGRRHGPWRAVPAEQRADERCWEIWMGGDRLCPGSAVMVAELAWSRTTLDWVLRAVPLLGGRTVRFPDPPGRGEGVGDWPIAVPMTVWRSARLLVAAWVSEVSSA